MGSFCGKCGNQMPEGVKFCPMCGSPVQQPSPAQENAFQQNDFPEYPAGGAAQNGGQNGYAGQGNGPAGGPYTGQYLSLIHI